MTEANEPPPSVRNMFKRLKHMLPTLSCSNSDFEPEPTDVLLCGAPKCGTTWMQQIVHSLRSRGDLSFEEILAVIPSIEFAVDPRYPSLDTPHPFSPRVFKSHLEWEQLPSAPCKRIYITRNPLDEAVSLYYFCEGMYFDKGEVALDEFVEWTVIKELPSGTIFANAVLLRHLGCHYQSVGYRQFLPCGVASWYPHRKDQNVLWLHYEDLKEDLPKCVAMISDFLQIGVGDEELLNLVVEQASFEFMKKHKSKYDVHYAKRSKASQGQSGEEWITNNQGKVRNGKMNEGARLLSDEMKQKMDAKWKSLVEPATGYATYEEMRAGINKELGRRFGAA